MLTSIKRNGYHRGTSASAHSDGSPQLGSEEPPALSKKDACATNSLLDQCGARPKSDSRISPITASKPGFINNLMQNLLELAAYFEANKFALFLLEHGASATVASDKKRATPLATALKTGNHELINGFFQQIDKNEFHEAFKNILESQSYKNTIEQVLASPALHDTNSLFATALKKAVEKENAALISRFFSFPRLSDKVLLGSLDDATKNKLLFLALSENKPAVARSLIEAGASLFAKNPKGHTPIWHAIATRQQEIAILLIEKAIQNDPGTKAIDGNTLLHAIKHQQNAVINLILDRTRPSERIEEILRNNYGNISRILLKTKGDGNSALASALIRSCLKNGNLEPEIPKQWQRLVSRVSKNEQSSIVKELFSKFALPENNEPNNLIIDTNETSPLMYAINNGHIEAAELLIKGEVDLSHKDVFGNTALLMAIRQKNTKIANLLIEKSNPTDLRKPNRKYALSVLKEAIENNLDITKKLLECLQQYRPAAEPASETEGHPLERSSNYDPFTISDFVAAALKAGKPSSMGVFRLFQFLLAKPKERDEQNNVIAVELARYVRKYHKQSYDDPLHDLAEELDAQKDPEFTAYLKAVDGFIARKEDASSLVSTLGKILSSAGEKTTS